MLGPPVEVHGKPTVPSSASASCWTVPKRGEAGMAGSEWEGTAMSFPGRTTPFRASRRITVAPGTCSGGSLAFGRIGDWTCEVVGSSCRINVHAARTPDGEAAYLSFFYG
ncbi:hypothetical protein [Kitasatospora sp. NPDC006786]|uniref:hypothetical protein n=2 Tax=Kitasatospora TaxID=2063 RepID=UPI00340762ED